MIMLSLPYSIRHITLFSLSISHTEFDWEEVCEKIFNIYRLQFHQHCTCILPISRFSFQQGKKIKLNRIVNHIQSAIIFISTRSRSLTEMSGEQHKCSLKILQCLHLLIVLYLLALSVAIALIHKIANSPQVVHSFLQFSRLHLIFKFIKWWPPTAMCKRRQGRHACHKFFAQVKNFSRFEDKIEIYWYIL